MKRSDFFTRLVLGFVAIWKAPEILAKSKAENKYLENFKEITRESNRGSKYQQYEDEFMQYKYFLTFMDSDDDYLYVGINRIYKGGIDDIVLLQDSDEIYKVKGGFNQYRSTFNGCFLKLQPVSDSYVPRDAKGAHTLIRIGSAKQESREVFRGYSAGRQK